MIYICKPKKISVYVNTAKKTAAQIKDETGCDALINGGVYDFSTFKPYCHLKVDGKILVADQYKYWGYAWNTDKLTLTNDYSNHSNYIACVCMVRNGQSENMYINSDMDGARPRTAMGLFADGRIWLYCDKTNKTPQQLRQIALDAGVESAIMLDGGGSTQGIFPTGAVTSTRRVHNYICVWENDGTDTEDKKMKVCIDPGHGGAESANGSPDGTYKEHEFTLDLALRIRKLLTGKVNVLLTRSVDMTVALNKRAQIANEGGADVFVSLHSNAAAGTGWSDAHGLCAYTYAAGGEREKLANAILDALGAAGVELRATRLNHAKFTVLANTTMPAVLVEYLFHNNKADVEKLKDSAFRDKLATATAKAILDYFGVALVEDKPAETVEPSNTVYRVQVGAFTNKAYAEALQKQLIAEGYNTILTES